MTASPDHRDRPWVFRTYSGHSSARASNELYRGNLAKGQTGLSVAFDLPTQTGFDSDHPLARGEVGKVGVPIGHIEDMQALFAGIPLDRMNTSMTINATAAWLLALYVATAERSGVAASQLSGTTQNDIIKEYLSRGTYVFPPEPSMRLTTDIVAYTVAQIPKWNPINVCSYHLQEAGATPTQEIAFAMANAIAVLDAVRARGDVPADAIPDVVGRISFFLNAGIRFVEEICKARAMAELWDEITARALRRRRPGAAPLPLRRAGEQPRAHRGAAREQRDPDRARGARRHVLEEGALPRAPAAGLERGARPAAAVGPAVVAAHPADPRLRDRPARVRGPVRRLARGREADARARSRARRRSSRACSKMGGAVAAVESAYMKQQLVAANTRRLRAIESGERTVVGVNAYTEAEPSPLTAGQSILVVDESAEREQIESLRAFRARRSAAEVASALRELDDALASGRNVMPVSIRAAHAGVTTGEWADALRKRFGEYRAPTGVVGGRVGRRERRDRGGAPARARARPASSGARSSCWSASPGSTATATAPSRSR